MGLTFSRNTSKSWPYVYSTTAFLEVEYLQPGLWWRFFDVYGNLNHPYTRALPTPLTKHGVQCFVPCETNQTRVMGVHLETGSG